MATIIVRRLDSSWDVLRGNGLGNFLTDIDAVAQIIKQRLLLLQQEWFLNTQDGTPLFQSLLGHPITKDAVAGILQARILGSPCVTGINSMSLVYGPTGRTFAFYASVQTQFGTITLSTLQFGGQASQ